ncbi:MULTISPECIES: thiamine pyrophosphate-dependent enzyme [Shewanella]|uniref:thiamine pyrophosphate-dependent enzyme n=1 Tax=Shewanella TaxID=22 RepID=UPI000C4A24E2|nr:MULTISPECIES: thiamine pyrophosphate-dependent enzyme [Shewanella]NCQ47152.1 ubiquinone-dependent pyruvate dehydrogenase [Shewanella frigidimarina]NCO73408.1 ubiquinone-dependent pyruvate dehydrogenase [Shewanella vesiculosa]NCP38641.1 ubiquinone-dependent pyruvate dehydrogenase [Shewanella vesiculosa]NCP71356.1 ubiquinone-dependent pyruvate dehydrogenase [Shewanella vesiculosa]NCP76293.1 ubiquinone-dependent pyruvate dehydrogenase [Shewanella vesiculosa]
MSKNVSDHLVEMLVEAGVKRVYAVTGDSLNPVNDAVRRDGRLQWIHVRHEEAGAYAASMEAELNGIGCCMGSSGPGHVHLVNGLYDANRAENPVIAIASTIHTEKMGLDNFQETRPEALFQDCSKYVFLANTPKQAVNGLQTAIQHAISKKGVAVLGLPGDVASASLESVHTANKNFYTQPRITPSHEQLQELANVINEHDKVMLFCGHGCRYAVEEVMQLAERLNAPLGYSFRGKIFFERKENPYAVGLNGLLGNKSGFEAMHQADVLLMLGTDFPYSEFLPEKCKIIQIDTKPEKLGRRAKVDLGYCGDIKSTLEDLMPLIDVKTSTDFLDKTRSLHQKIEAIYESYVEEKGSEKNIHPEYVAHLVDKLADDDAIFTVDTGMSAVWAARYLKAGANRYLTGSFNHGSMANAMPMAMGAGLSQPDRQVIAFCGDGGISMLLGDLMTISQYQIPVKIIIFNNRSLAMVKLEMRVEGYMEWQTDMVNPDFIKLAEAMNIAAWEATESKDVELALANGFKHKGPAIINIFTDPNALAMPPTLNFEQVKGFAASMTKLMVNGKFAEIVDTTKNDLKYLREL